MRKFSIDRDLKVTGSEFNSGPFTHTINHGDDTDEEYGEGSVPLTSHNFDRVSHMWVNLNLSVFLPEFHGRFCGPNRSPA